MFPKISLDEVADGIWIGNSNLFRPATSRRYLMGLAAYTGQPLRFVPALLEESEIPGQFAASCMRIRSRYISEDDDRTLDIYDECHELARQSFVNWLAKWVKNGAIAVLDITDRVARARMIGVMERYTLPARVNASTNQDQIILSECVVSNAQFIATNNFHSIKHNAVNVWARKRGRNHNLIGSLSELSQLLIDEKQELAIVGAMITSYAERSVEEQKKSIKFFINTLHGLEHNALGYRVQETLNNLKWEELQQFVTNSRELSQTPEFVQARAMNDELLMIKNQVQQRWQELESEIDNDQSKGPSL